MSNKQNMLCFNGEESAGKETKIPPNFNGQAGNTSDSTMEPIAIVGMAMRLPGGIRNAEAFWELLISRSSGRCRVPKNRYNVDGWYGPGKAGHVSTEYGYFLEDLDLAALDASFWSMTQQEATAMDPQQRLLLEVVYECLENSGTKDWRGKDIGCFVGNFGEDWLDLDMKDAQHVHDYRLTGTSDFVAANRISYEFDFKGPRYVYFSAQSEAVWPELIQVN
jgi:acyl transferase domain-containing protein